MRKIKENSKKSIPKGIWTKCPKCKEIVFNKELVSNFKICPKCEYYFRLNVNERLDMLLEEKSFKEFDKNLSSCDPLSFVDTKSYKERIKASLDKTKRNAAVVTGEGKIGPHKVIIGVMDFGFMGGSMGSVVGEKIVRAIEKAIKNKMPMIMVSASGGARMQESILSLMQMAKTSAAVAQLGKNGVPYVSILTDPTTGGVTASFAMLGDINISEPNALIAFAGPRVIEQTIRQQLPPGFQRAEFQLKHGMLDMIVKRKELKNIIINILSILGHARGKKVRKHNIIPQSKRKKGHKRSVQQASKA